jgi:type II secretory pathway component PulF
MAITEKKELKYQKLSFLCSLLSAIFMGAVLAVVITVVLYAMPKVDAIYKSTMISLQNLETLTTSLNQADLAGTVNNINELTVQATDSLGNTMDRINSIDLEKLNTAIANLNATIEPMAAFFNVLGN